MVFIVAWTMTGLAQCLHLPNKNKHLKKTGVFHRKSSILRMVVEYVIFTQDSKCDYILWRYSNH